MSPAMCLPSTDKVCQEYSESFAGRRLRRLGEIMSSRVEDIRKWELIESKTEQWREMRDIREHIWALWAGQPDQRDATSIISLKCRWLVLARGECEEPVP